MHYRCNMKLMNLCNAMHVKVRYVRTSKSISFTLLSQPHSATPAVCVLIDATALVFLRDPQLHHQPQHHHDERRAEGGEGHTSRGTSNLLPQEFLISRSSSTRMTGKEQLCV